MSLREDLATEVAETVGLLNAKVQETITLGRPGDTTEYADALNSAANAYDALDPADED
jgi:hypothetical protein